jgi:hypothetical protein
MVILGFSAAVGGCYPGELTNVQDADVVLTVHNESVDFGSFQSFAMPDSVVHVSGKIGDDLINVPRTFDDLILDLAAANMASLGYTRELSPETNGADLILQVAVVGVEKTEYWVYQDWWGYWGWYPGWGYYPPTYGPGWGYYYPPTYVGSSTFEQGTILLTLVDPNDPDTEDRTIPVVWSGAGRGLLSGGGAEARITRGVNKMFTQSPYLGR